MRLYPNQLSNHLKSKLLPSYLLGVEEPLLSQECRDALIKAGRSAGFSSRNLLHVESGFDWDDFVQQTNTLSLFSDQQIIDLRFNNKVDAKAGKILLSYFENPNPDILLIISVAKIDGALQKAKWFKALDKLGAWCPIKPLDGRQFAQWLQQRSNQQGLRCNTAALQQIAQRTEGNLLAAAQELDKLSLLYPPDTPITEQEVSQAVANSARYDLFKWVAIVLMGDATKAIRMLQGMKTEGTDPILILWAISREIRTLYELNQSTARGSSLAAAMQDLKIWNNRQPLFKKTIQRLPKTVLPSLLQQCSTVDLAIKGMNRESPWLCLEQITLALCGCQLTAAQA